MGKLEDLSKSDQYFDRIITELNGKNLLKDASCRLSCQVEDGMGQCSKVLRMAHIEDGVRIC
jgi:hypothetical protein